MRKLIIQVALVPILFGLFGIHSRRNTTDVDTDTRSTDTHRRNPLPGNDHASDSTETRNRIAAARVQGAASPDSTASQQDSSPIVDDSTQTFDEYRDSLPTQTPRGKAGSPEQAYQIKHAGDTEYRISGDGSQVWADGIQGIDTTTGEAIDAKYVGNPERSPFVPGSGCPDFIRTKIDESQRDEFQRYANVVNSDDNPLTGLQVITNTEGSADYFRGLMQEYNIPGSVSVKD
jgi:hypothetical protein